MTDASLLTKDEISAFRRDGAVVLRQKFSAD